MNPIGIVRSCRAAAHATVSETSSLSREVLVGRDQDEPDITWMVRPLSGGMQMVGDLTLPRRPIQASQNSYNRADV
jgi:hypothetical protein